MKSHVLLAALAVMSLGLVSCEQAQESDDLAKAQKCLDEVPASNPAAASNCLHHVEKYSSQQANILKCSIHMTSGGLIENKIVKAYEALKGGNITPQNRTAAYMAMLSLDVPNASDGYTKAQLADPFCQATGVPGLRFLSGVIVAGSWMAKSIAALPGNVEIGQIIDNPTAISSAINDLLDPATGCNSPAPPAPCDTAEEMSQLGLAVANLSVSYCANEEADASVCEEINQAKEAAGNNSTDIGQAMLCFLKGKGFANGACTP